jgi:hypothetical protein
MWQNAGAGILLVAVTCCKKQHNELINDVEEICNDADCCACAPVGGEGCISKFYLIGSAIDIIVNYRAADFVCLTFTFE